ncbi:MAG: hypothetical protein GY846_08115 [Deltaproteobacteria bacterium]|nr:hypothetical protein [Deltaproteobacteria bacterium]
MKPELLKSLQKQLDMYSMGFPATKSGIENQILEYLFSENDAAMFLVMTPQLETPEAVAGRLEKPVEEVAAHLDDMAERGLLFRLKKGAASKYGAIPFVHGLFEFQVKSLKKDLAQMVEEYFDEAFGTAMQKGVDYFLRPIPIQQSIEMKHQVASIKGGLSREKTSPCPFKKDFFLSGISKMPPSLLVNPTRFFIKGTEEGIRTEHPYGLFTLNDPG